MKTADVITPARQYTCIAVMDVASNGVVRLAYGASGGAGVIDVLPNGQRVLYVTLVHALDGRGNTITPNATCLLPLGRDTFVSAHQNGLVCLWQLKGLDKAKRHLNLNWGMSTSLFSSQLLLRSPGSVDTDYPVRMAWYGKCVLAETAAGKVASFRVPGHVVAPESLISPSYESIFEFLELMDGRFLVTPVGQKEAHIVSSTGARPSVLGPELALSRTVALYGGGAVELEQSWALAHRTANIAADRAAGRSAATSTSEGEAVYLTLATSDGTLLSIWDARSNGVRVASLAPGAHLVAATNGAAVVTAGPGGKLTWWV